MVEGIKTICLVSMLGGIVGSVIPSGKMKKAFSTFCAVIVVFYMTGPLADIKADSLKLFSYESKNREEALLSDVRDLETMLYEGILERGLEKRLDEEGLKVSVKPYCQRLNEEIRVVYVEVENAGGEEERERVKNILSEILGEAEIKFEGDENG